LDPTVAVFQVLLVELTSVRSSGSPVPAVVLPLRRALAMSAAFVLSTAFAAIVVAFEFWAAVTSPVSAARCTSDALAMIDVEPPTSTTPVVYVSPAPASVDSGWLTRLAPTRAGIESAATAKVEGAALDPVGLATMTFAACAASLLSAIPAAAFTSASTITPAAMAVVLLPDAFVTSPKSGPVFVWAMAAAALTSALTITPGAIAVVLLFAGAVMSPVSAARSSEIDPPVAVFHVLVVELTSVRSSGSPEAAVVRPFSEGEGTFAAFAFDTASFAIVVALLFAGAVTSPVSAARSIDKLPPVAVFQLAVVEFTSVRSSGAPALAVVR